eukprot:684655-Prymnesium_polylepis.1
MNLKKPTCVPRRCRINSGPNALEGCAASYSSVPETLRWKHPSHDRREERWARPATFRHLQGPKTPVLCARSNPGVLAAASCSARGHQI